MTVIMSLFWSAILGAVVGTVGSSLAMLLVQSRAWKHESEVRREDLRRSVMPYITFEVTREGMSHGPPMGAGGVAFQCLERVVASNHGRGLATFSPTDVADSYNNSRELGGFPVGTLRRYNLPTELKPGASCEIGLAFRYVRPVSVTMPGNDLNLKRPFEYSDMYGNRYRSELTIYWIPDQGGKGEKWEIHAGQPELMPITLFATRPDWQVPGEGGAPHDLG